MRIAIVGAGAVGAYYGARLAQVGHEVTLVARGAKLDAFRRQGIRVRTSAGEFAVPVRAESDPSSVGPADLVIFAVKTYSNPQAIPLLPPLLGPATAVLPLQNGIDSAEQIAAAIGAGPVLAGTTYIGATMVEPGVIEYVGTVRRIVFGEAFGPRVITPRVERIRETLAAADIQADAAADSRIALWEKFIVLAPVAAFTAAARLPIGPAWAQPAFREAVAAAIGEVAALARHAGVKVAADIVEQKLSYLDSSPPTMRSSMMVDLTSGRPLELDALVGMVVRRGKAAGIPTPVMSAIYGVLQPFEGGGGWR